MRKVFLFMDTITNKVDAKGRVSLPSDYRAIVKELSTEIENSTDFFSETQDNLTNLIFGDAKRFLFDSTGRIVLTDKLLQHAGIMDSAVFVGKGRKFQIWNPENWAKEEARIRAEALKNRPVLRQSREAE